MASLFLRRMGFSLFSLLVVSLLLFVLTRSIPDSPARIVLGDQATAQQIEQFDREHGLDQPIVVQYAIWLERLGVEGGLCRSFTTGLCLKEPVAGTFPVTVELGVVPVCVGTVGRVFLGTVAAFY